MTGLGPVSPQERSRSHRPIAVSQHGAVDGLVGLRPAVLAVAEDELALHPGARHQALHPHADEPDPGPLQAERVEHANLERPGAQAHPKAQGWTRVDYAAAWRAR